MLVLLGSSALAHYTKLDRVPADLDVLGDYDKIISRYKTIETKACYPINGGKKLVIKNDTLIVEAELTWPGSLSEELYNLVLANPHTKQNGLIIPGLNILYLLKMSHRYLKNSPHFLKTMRDIKLMRSLEAMITPELKEFFVRREKETYTYRHPSLKSAKSAFFTGDGVKYVYDHDSIHEAVAIGREPAYRAYQKEGKEVECDKGKWLALSETDRLSGVLEEAYVLALERSQIPYPGVLTPRQSFNKALEKVCTSITSGWFREYAWENYDKVQAVYNNAYVDMFWDKVKEGKVKLYGS